MPPVFSSETGSQDETASTDLEPPEPSFTPNPIQDVYKDWISGPTNRHEEPWTAETYGQQSSAWPPHTGLIPDRRCETLRSEYNSYTSSTHDWTTFESPPTSISETSRPFRSIAPRTRATTLAQSSSGSGLAPPDMSRLHGSVTEDPSEPFLQCHKCGAFIRGVHRRRNLTRHIQTVHENQTSQCAGCSKIFRRSDARRKHCFKYHPELVKQSVVGNQNGHVPSEGGQPSVTTEVSSGQSEDMNPFTGFRYDIATQSSQFDTSSDYNVPEMSGSQEFDTGLYDYLLTSPTDTFPVPDQFCYDSFSRELDSYSPPFPNEAEPESPRL